ncbi:hypothetical protein LCGC14_2736690 [marine sediment metagenome]|uniref:Uncharacterized protein n=1 Tax=marine sediment metagenome TaxID=412755 RepID=A0A0F9BXC0_9ZZZZ
MSLFGWDYPPGVTGNEYEIAGPDHEEESEEPCTQCGAPTMEQGYGGERWLVCDNDHVEDIERMEDDPDRLYDEMRDRQMLEDQSC